MVPQQVHKLANFLFHLSYLVSWIHSLATAVCTIRTSTNAQLKRRYCRFVASGWCHPSPSHKVVPDWVGRRF